MIGLRGCARLSAIALVVISLFKETLYPRRWTYSDLLYLVPVLACAIIASVPSRRVGYRTRAMAGVYLGLGFLFVINDYRTLVEDDLAQIAFRSSCCMIACMAVFATVTECISRLVGARGPKWEFCQKCGYCLFGLADPRCPECGTPIPEDQIKGLAAMQTQGGPFSRREVEGDCSETKPA